MKQRLLLTLILVSTIFLPDTFAQDYTQFSLPEGAEARLGKGWSTEIQYSPDGSLLAVASSIGIWLYDAETGAEKALLTGHTERVTSVSFNSDGTVLASGSWDDTVRLWDVATRTLKTTLTGHEDNVNSVHFSPDDTMVASGSADDSVGLWDLATETRKATLWHRDDVNSVRFRPDGATLASAGDDNYVRLWDIGTLTQKATLEPGYRDDVYSISFSPDGNTIATATEDRYASLWDVGTAALIGELKPAEGPGEVYYVNFSRDGETLACSSPGGTLRLWDVATRTENATLIKGPSRYVSRVSFSPDRTTLASASWDEVRLWNVATGSEKPTFTWHNGGVRSMSFNSDGSLLANSAWNDTINLWDVATRTLKATLSHGEYFWSVWLSPDGTTLASRTWGGTLRLWDVVTETEKTAINDVYGANFSLDGAMLATGHNGNVQLWDLTTLTRIITFPSPGYNRSLDFSSDDTLLASGSSDHSVRLWDLTTLERKAERWHGDDVNRVHFSPDGSLLASGSDDNTARLWDVTTLQQKATLQHSDNVNSVDFSPDGKTLVSLKVDYRGTWDRWLHLWDVETGKSKAALEHSSSINTYTFSRDGTTLASGSDDNTVRLWDVTTGTHKATLTGHTADVNSVHFSPDGSLLASGSNDGSVLFWEFSTMRTVGIAPAVVESAAIGEQLTVQLNITAGSNVGGYQATVGFDPTVLRYVESANGDYLPEGAFFLEPIAGENSVQVAGTSLTGISQKTEGSLATLTFEVVAIKESVLKLSNVILTDINGEHLPHFTVSGRVIEPKPLTSPAVVRVTPAVANSPEVGETIVFNADITGGENIANYELVWHYDETALEFVSSEKSRYIPTAGPSRGIGKGDGTLATATFRVKVIKSSTVRVSGFFTASNGLHSIPTFESAQVNAPVFGDVNRDGEVNILDLVAVASNFGKPVPEEGHPADVNEDGLINIVDLVKVAGALGTGTAAPAVLAEAQHVTLTRADVQQWLTQAQLLNLTDPTSLHGIRFLEQLLAALTPKETALLHNYPNPFNPETWIPYQLAKPAAVTLTIYAVDGKLVRRLDLGHQPIGIYESKSRAAYWDGRNAVGESVASGVYFYTLTAGDFTATRKMLILK